MNRRRFKTRYLRVDWRDASKFQRLMFLLTWAGVIGFNVVAFWAIADDRIPVAGVALALVWVSALWPCYTGDRKREVEQ